MTRLTITIMLLCTPLFAHGASFNCTAATTEVEKTICDNGYLGGLDEELAYYYNRLKNQSNTDEGALLLSGQRAWLKERNN